jgi:hypothetical protein
MRPSIIVRQLLRRILPFALVVAGMWTSPGLAAGPTGWGGGSCHEITGFPANITGPGVYCLSFKYIDFPLAQGALITISADDVVLDLNGATLDGTPTVRGAFSYGVRAFNRKNVTVRNGTIKGFNYAVHLMNITGELSDPRPSVGWVVENIRAIKSRTGGIHVVGNDSEIRSNYIANTGYSNDPGVVPNTWAIWAAGWGLRILDNDVLNTRPNGSSGGEAYAIYLAGCREAIVVNNRITDASFGIYGFGPIASWGKYRDNVTINIGVPYTGGTDIGNNN